MISVLFKFSATLILSEKFLLSFYHLCSSSWLFCLAVQDPDLGSQTEKIQIWEPGSGMNILDHISES
jgi:hypothetical protein